MEVRNYQEERRKKEEIKLIKKMVLEIGDDPLRLVGSVKGVAASLFDDMETYQTEIIERIAEVAVLAPGKQGYMALLVALIQRKVETLTNLVMDQVLLLMVTHIQAENLLALRNGFRFFVELLNCSLFEADHLLDFFLDLFNHEYMTPVVAAYLLASNLPYLRNEICVDHQTKLKLIFEKLSAVSVPSVENFRFFQHENYEQHVLTPLIQAASKICLDNEPFMLADSYRSRYFLKLSPFFGDKTDLPPQSLGRAFEELPASTWTSLGVFTKCSHQLLHSSRELKFSENFPAFNNSYGPLETLIADHFRAILVGYASRPQMCANKLLKCLTWDYPRNEELLIELVLSTFFIAIYDKRMEPIVCTKLLVILSEAEPQMRIKLDHALYVFFCVKQLNCICTQVLSLFFVTFLGSLSSPFCFPHYEVFMANRVNHDLFFKIFLAIFHSSDISSVLPQNCIRFNETHQILKLSDDEGQTNEHLSNDDLIKLVANKADDVTPKIRAILDTLSKPESRKRSHDDSPDLDAYSSVRFFFHAICYVGRLSTRHFSTVLAQHKDLLTDLMEACPSRVQAECQCGLLLLEYWTYLWPRYEACLLIMMDFHLLSLEGLTQVFAQAPSYADKTQVALMFGSRFFEAQLKQARSNLETRLEGDLSAEDHEALTKELEMAKKHDEFYYQRAIAASLDERSEDSPFLKGYLLSCI